MRSIGVGIIGLGWMGKLHAKTIGVMPEAELVAVCDTDAGAVEQVAGASGARGHTDYRALLDDDTVEAVIVALPPYLNLEVVGEAVRRGKHILCEKPIAHDLADAYAIRDLASGYDRKIMIGFTERFSMANEDAQRIVRGGALGRVSFVRANCRWASKEKTFGAGGGHGTWFSDPAKGGGILTAVGIHYYDLVRWYTGAEFVEVYVVAQRPPGSRPGSEVMMTLLGHLDSGAIVLFDLVTTLPMRSPSDRRLELVGTTGSIYVDQLQHFLMAVSEHGIEVTPGLLETGLALPESMYLSEAFGSVRRELDYFVGNCVLDGAEPHPSVDDGVRALEVAVAAVRSWETGVPVALGAGPAPVEPPR